ncbi:unnamed protein product, partial [Iphiclides podalirius]
MTQNSCCVPGCLVTSKDGVPLHCFPNPDTDAVRFQTWVSNVGLDVLQFDNDTIRKKKRVCHKHFKSIYHYTKNRLCRLATPELQMPAMQTPTSVKVVITDEQTTSTSTDLQSEKLIFARKYIILKQ